ncbi:MAG TPA: TIGR02266 family protein [Anaeromyxobacteraceae bacterium]|jgi:type IV pilus assembly protein PilZ
MAENREHPRAPIELRVDYRRLNSFFADYTKNISKGGTFIKTNRALPVGTRFRFQLSVPVREQPFEIAGEVVHAGGEGMGIRFAWGSEEERQAFESLVEQLMVESLGPEVARNLLKHSR